MARSLKSAGVGPRDEFLKADKMNGEVVAIEGAVVRYDEGNREAKIKGRWVIDFYLRLLKGDNAGATGKLSLGWRNQDGDVFESRAKLFEALKEGPIYPVKVKKGDGQQGWVGFEDYDGPVTVPDSAIVNKGTKELKEGEEDDGLPF